MGTRGRDNSVSNSHNTFPREVKRHIAKPEDSRRGHIIGVLCHLEISSYPSPK